MKTTELLRFQMTMGKEMTAALLADMLDAPLTFPTASGGNHPTWVAGHLVYAESNLIHHILQGNENPLLAWKSVFGQGTEPMSDAENYPALGELLSKWDEARKYTLEVLATVTDDDLDQPSASPPEGREHLFGTVGKVFSMVAMHPLVHRGQVADARRAAGRQKLMI